MIGPWKSSGDFGSMEGGVKRIIPIESVLMIEPLSASSLAIGQKNQADEEAERVRKEQENPERCVHLKEITPLYARIAELERQLEILTRPLVG